MAMAATAANVPTRQIPGTPVFDGRAAMRGLALNAMCYSLNYQANRDSFKADPTAYCRRFGLDDEQMHAVKSLDVLAMLRAGGNVEYLAMLVGMYRLHLPISNTAATTLLREPSPGG